MPRSENPMIVLLDALETGTSDGVIERQEARGQAAMVGSEDLPIECVGCVRADFEKMGVVFHERVDDLFVKVTLPSGWKKVAFPDHTMWSRLIDSKGRERARIFYKAAFYDRRASIYLSRRFSVGMDLDRNCWHVFDGEKPIWSSDKVVQSKRLGDMTVEERVAFIGKTDHLRASAEEWLNAHYPKWRDPHAYWD